jgi:predicted AlkP superfamily phosphohydrolase/phosphomutase
VSKVAVIGLDGMAWHILDKLFEYGAMPALKKVVKKSLRGVLQSTIPPTSPPAWTSIATGVNPGKHGVFNFVAPNETDEWRVLTSNDVAYPRLHEMVAMRGIKSICVNQPCTYPIVKLKNNRVISDWMSPRLSYYPNLLDRYAKMYSPYVSKWVGGFATIHNFLNMVFEGVVARVEAVNAMMEELDWELFWAVYSEPDHVFHKCYDAVLKGEECAMKIFEKLDETVEKANQLSDLTFVVSDHGFAKYDYMIYINSFLDNLGLISKTWRKTTKGIHDFHTETKLPRKYLKIPPPLYRLFSLKPTKALVKKVYRLLTGKDLRAQLPFVDIRKSKAFMSQQSYGIYVKAKDYTDLIVDELRNRHYIDRVFRKEELFHGPFANQAPDILFIPDLDHGYNSGAITVPTREAFTQVNYSHHLEGVVMVYGDGVNPEWIDRINTVDIVPTILKYLGLPLPNDTDGKRIRGVRIKEAKPKTYNYLNHWRLTKKIHSVKQKLAKRFD